MMKPQEHGADESLHDGLPGVAVHSRSTVTTRVASRAGSTEQFATRMHARRSRRPPPPPPTHTHTHRHRDTETQRHTHTQTDRQTRTPTPTPTHTSILKSLHSMAHVSEEQRCKQALSCAEGLNSSPIRQPHDVQRYIGIAKTAALTSALHFCKKDIPETEGALVLSKPRRPAFQPCGMNGFAQNPC